MGMVTVNISEGLDLISYVEEATKEWPEEKRQRLGADLSAALGEDGVSIKPEKGHYFVAFLGPSVYQVLNEHGLNPVC